MSYEDDQDEIIGAALEVDRLQDRNDKLATQVGELVGECAALKAQLEAAEQKVSDAESYYKIRAWTAEEFWRHARTAAEMKAAREDRAADAAQEETAP